MAIITISRGSYHRGQQVAEAVARALGYECISREVLLTASKEFNVPDTKLVHAMQNAPSILERFTGGKEKYIAFVQAALLRQVEKDNVVYHGFAGQCFLPGISHVLKVRIISYMEDRVRLAMERDGISASEAVRVLKNDDEERRKWGLHLYGMDVMDPSFYDLVIQIKQLTVAEAAEIICGAAASDHFCATPASQKALSELTVATAVRAALIGLKPEIAVTVRNGVAHLKAKAASPRERAALSQMARSTPGVEDVIIEADEIGRHGR